MVPSGVRFAIRPLYPRRATGYTQLSAAPGGTVTRPRAARSAPRSPGAAPAMARRRGAPQAGGVADVGARLEQAIDALLDDRRAGATICPSEAARAVDPEGWRELMPAARAAAGRLAAAGRVEVTQRGEVVDVATARGPVRVRRPQS